MQSKRQTFLFNIMCMLLIVVGAMGLMGCAAVRGVIEGQGGAYAQEGLQTSEDVICKYAPVGSVIRRYGSQAKKWASFCMSTDASPDGISNYFGDLAKTPEASER